jgi:hypothetical protein
MTRKTDQRNAAETPRTPRTTNARRRTAIRSACVVALAIATWASPAIARACGDDTAFAAAASAPAAPIDAALHAKLLAEHQAQAQFWGNSGASASFSMYDDRNSPNAWAGCASQNDCAQGWIRFGQTFTAYHLQQHGEVALAGTLAHEWAHRVQQVNGWFAAQSMQARELEADAMSGYYMARTKGVDLTNAPGFFQHWYSLGAATHGTHGQRLAAARVGVQLWQWQASANRGIGYPEMHQYLAQQVAAILQTVR